MAEYIDKDKLENYAMGCIGGSVTIRQIHEFSAEDVAPVKHGKWENQAPTFCWNKYGVYQTAYKCSVCGEMTPIDYNICPWCGAKMDGE